MTWVRMCPQASWIPMVWRCMKNGFTIGSTDGCKIRHQLVDGQDSIYESHDLKWTGAGFCPSAVWMRTWSSDNGHVFMSLFEWTWSKSGCSHQKLRFDHQDIWLKQHRQNFTKNWFSQKSTRKHHIKLIKFDPMEHEKAGVHAWFWQIEGPRSWSFSWNFWWPLPMYTTHPGYQSQVHFFY